MPSGIPSCRASRSAAYAAGLLGTLILVAHGSAQPAAAPRAASPSARWRVEPVGQVGGSARAVAVTGTLAYLGVGPRLETVDVSDPAAPRRLGRTAPLPGVVHDLVARGRMVYVATAKGWQPGAALVVVDAADPAAPRAVGSLALTLPPTGLGLAGSAVVIADGQALRTVDVADPARPRTLAVMSVPGGASVLAVQDDLAVVAGAGQVTTIDLADPARPVLGTSQSVAGSAAALALVSPYVYLVGDSGLTVLDVSGADGIRGLKLLSIGTTLGRAIAVTGGVAYVAYGTRLPANPFGQLPKVEGGLITVDVRDPGHPWVLGAWVGHGAVQSVALSERGALLALPDFGLRVVDVSQPAKPRPAGSLTGAGLYRALAVGDRRVVAAGDESGLTSFTHEPADGSLHFAGRLDTPERVAGLALADGSGGDGERPRAYLVAPAGLSVAALPGDGPPQVLGAADGLGRPAAVRAVPGHALIADNAALAVYRISPQGAPALVARATGHAGATALGLSAGYAFVLANGGRGSRLFQYDVADPETPRLAGSRPVSGTAGLAVGERFALVLDFEAVQRVDISAAPGAPTRSWLVPDRPSAVALLPGEGGALVGGMDVGLHAVDLAGPAGSASVTRLAASLQVADIQVVGDLAYVAALESGLWTLRLVPGPPAPVLLPILARP
jgi:hypothetical protein